MIRFRYKKCRSFCMLLTALLLAVPPVSAGAASVPSVSASSAFLMDAVTGTVLYERSADTPRAIASTTKIMTAILCIESGNLNRQVRVPAEALTEGSSLGLTAGDRVTMLDLCYGMLLESGNDAANAAALCMAESYEHFAALMNNKAAELGLTQTHFVTPSGLDAGEHYSTARDLAVLTQYAMKNTLFAEIVATERASVRLGPAGDLPRTVTNHNRLLTSCSGVCGVKTGFTKKAGRCLVSAAKRDGGYLIAVTLCDPDDWNDHAALYEYGFSELSELTFPGQTPCFSVTGADLTQVEGAVLLPRLSVPEAAKSDFALEYLPVSAPLAAPVRAGQVIGTAVIRYRGTVVAEAPVTARESAGLLPAADGDGWLCRLWKNFCRLTAV